MFKNLKDISFAFVFALIPYLNLSGQQIKANELEIVPEINTIELNADTEVGGTLGSGSHNVNGDISATGSISATGTITSGSLSTNGTVALNKGLEIVGIREYSGANTFVHIPISSPNQAFHATITISGQQLNNWNRRFMWHGILTWDPAPRSQHNLYEIKSENTSVEFAGEIDGVIKLKVNSLNTSFHYVLYRGQAFISKGG